MTAATHHSRLQIGPGAPLGASLALAGALVAAPLAGPGPAAARDLESASGLVAGGAAALQLGRAAYALVPPWMPVPRPPLPRPPRRLFVIGPDGGAPAGAVALTYFTPRPGGRPLGLVGPGALAAGAGGAGIAVVLERPLEAAASGVPAGVTVSLGAAAASWKLGGEAATAARSQGAAGNSEAFGVGGRIAVSGFSFAGFLAASGNGGGAPARAPVAPAGAGYDLGLSYALETAYAFETGIVTLSRFHGGETARGAASRDPLDTVTVAGRYVLGPGLDMTALVAYSERNESEAGGDIGAEGWALLTGFRLSF